MAFPKLNRNAWLAAWLQKRRRKRAAAPQPNAPVITAGGFSWDTTEAGFADVWVAWTFDHGTFPVATVELWVVTDGGPLTLLVTIPSTEVTFIYTGACTWEATFEFQVRYRDGATIGPFSNVYPVAVQL